MRYRPSWEAKRKRGFKHGRGAPQAMLAKRTSFGDFSEGTGRRQCVALSKRSGERCRRDAVGGELRCRTHWGVSPAVRNAMRVRKVRRSSDKYLIAGMKVRALYKWREPLITKIF